MNHQHIKGVSFTALGVVILSFDALLVRLIESGAMPLLFWRGFFLSVIVYLWLKARPGKTAKINIDWPYFRSALFYYFATLTFIWALQLTSAANVLIIISAQPLLAAIMARVFLKEKTPLKTWIAVLIAIAGIVWIMKDSWQSQNLLGDFLALLCGLAVAAKFVNDRAVNDRNMAASLILAGIFMAATGLAFSNPLQLASSDWLWIVILCVLVVPTAFILIAIGPMHLPATEVSMLMLLETVLGPVWVWIYLDEAPSLAALQGGTVVVLVLVIHAWSQAKKPLRATTH